jgi:hypothetical protein
MTRWQRSTARTHTNALVAASNVEYDQNDISDEFAADLATISKIHIVASDDTIEAVMAVHERAWTRVQGNDQTSNAATHMLRE